jgi:hypothetical protein
MRARTGSGTSGGLSAGPLIVDGVFTRADGPGTPPARPYRSAAVFRTDGRPEQSER